MACNESLMTRSITPIFFANQQSHGWFHVNSDQATGTVLEGRLSEDEGSKSFLDTSFHNNQWFWGPHYRIPTDPSSKECLAINLISTTVIRWSILNKRIK
jgi:hypothetical protein